MSLNVLMMSRQDTIASDNLDEGFDFDEADAGEVDASFDQVTANNNFNEGK